MRTFLRLLRYARPDAARLAAVGLLALLGAAFELARPWPVKIVVDAVLGRQPGPAWLTAALGGLPAGDRRGAALLACVAAAFAITLGASLVSYLVLTAVVAVAQRMVFALSRDLFARLQRLSLAYHGRHAVGDLLQRVSSDAFVVHFAISQIALPGLVAVVTLGGMFAVMAHIDLGLTLVAAAVTPLLAVALAAFARPIERSTERQWQSHGALMALAEQGLGAIRMVQGFAREPHMQRELEGRARMMGDAYSGATRVTAAYKEVTTAVTGAAAALVLWLGGRGVLAGRLSVGDLFIFLGYLAGLSGPVNALSTAVGAGIGVVTRGRRVFAVLDSREEIAERPGALRLTRARGEVVFEHVTFGYDAPGDDGPADQGPADDRPKGATPNADTAPAVLRDVSFRAAPGQITAIVGATGAGKSSLVALLSRFYDPRHGRVLVDGHDVRDLTLASLRENVSLVLQEPFLFPMTVAENVAFGRPDATRAQVIEAARAAQAHDFITRLPDGYDTVLGERGATLSGGERQRIAIARAVLKDAPILILDEPTSALDAHTEARIFEALSALIRGRTTFIISHRLSTIRQADQILALDGGRVVERGTHEALLAAGEVYAGLYRHQHIAIL